MLPWRRPTPSCAHAAACCFHSSAAGTAHAGLPVPGAVLQVSAPTCRSHHVAVHLQDGAPIEQMCATDKRNSMEQRRCVRIYGDLPNRTAPIFKKSP